MPFKQECLNKRVNDEGIATPLDTWEATFDKLYSSQRAAYLIAFLELRISILRNMGVGVSKKKKNTSDVKNHLLGIETWTCPCCHTKHGQKWGLKRCLRLLKNIITARFVPAVEMTRSTVRVSLVVLEPNSSSARTARNHEP